METKWKKEILDNFEYYLGSIFLFVTTLLTICTVFTRYCLGFTWMWSSDIVCGCFIWTIFLGAAGSFRKGTLMGVDIIMQITKGLTKQAIDLIKSLLLIIITSSMFLTSLRYVLNSNKKTAAMEISYNYINISIPIAFALMVIYSVVFCIISTKKLINCKKNQEVK